MLKKLEIITLILIKIIYNSNLLTLEENKQLKSIADDVRQAKTETALNHILRNILLLEDALNKKKSTQEGEISLSDDCLFNFIKKISKLTNYDKFVEEVKEVEELNPVVKKERVMLLFKEQLDYLENYIKNVSNQELKYNEVSEVLNTMFETISKLPKKNSGFKEKLFDIKEKIDASNSIKDIKVLKSSLNTMIDEIQDEISELNKDLNKILDNNLKFANLRIKALENKIIEVQKDSYTDSLTGALNRKWFDENFDDFFWFEKSKSHLFAFLDIDYFKLVNDSYGHSVGDYVLTELVRRFRKALRGNREDKIIRYGGDEFILILTNLNEEHIQSILQRLLASISEDAFKKDNMFINVTISIGVSMFHESESPEDLLKIADRRLYLSKENGRNRFTKEG